jgi:uncharacterized glyoxalase superfamily protein PhnB
MPKAIPDGFHTVTPAVTFKDSRKAIQYYEKAFGARLMFLSPGPDGKRVMHAQLQIGNSTLMMSDEWDQMCVSAETLGKSPIAFYIYVEDVDAAFQRAVNAGAAVQMPVMDAFWGDRAGTLKDPFGYMWTIATHTRDLTPDQIAKGAEEFFAQMAKK